MNESARSETVDIVGVPCFRWTKAGQDVVGNFGDELGPLIVGAMVGRLPDAYAAASGRRLLSIGSVLHFAEASDVVWGSGINGKVRRQRYPARLDVRSVRGPFTRAALMGHGVRVPAVYGDPALLLADLFPREVESRTREVAVVPNLNEIGAYAQHPGLISPLGRPFEVIDEILRSGFVAGSSLHALIVADAYGVPSRPIVSSVEHAWKYADYYLGTGRADVVFARSVEEAIELGPVPAAQFDVDALTGSFPRELWGAQPQSLPAAPAPVTFAGLRRAAAGARDEILAAMPWDTPPQYASAIARLDQFLARDLPSVGFTREESEATGVRLPHMASRATREHLTLSVIIPVHDVRPWIEDTLQSVLAQDVEGMEVIVVDDHSTDGTVEAVTAIARADERVRIIEAVSRGGGTARNIGLDHARGKYLVFCDGDDLVPDGAYAALVSSLERTGSDIAFGDYLKFSPSDVWRPTDSMVGYSWPAEGITVPDSPTLMYSRPCWNKAFSRGFWEATGIRFPDVPRSNDIVPMTTAYLAARRVDVIDDVVYLYRERPGLSSMTAKSDSTDSLLSYLTQEAACERLVAQTHDARLDLVYSALLYDRDAFVHLAKYLARWVPGGERDVDVVRSVSALMRARAPRRDGNRLRILCFELVADGRFAVARALARLLTSPGATQGQRLEWWRDAVDESGDHLGWLSEDAVIDLLAPDLAGEISPDDDASAIRLSLAARLDEILHHVLREKVPELVVRPDLSLVDVNALRMRNDARVTEVLGGKVLRLVGRAARGGEDTVVPSLFAVQHRERAHLIRPRQVHWKQAGDGTWHWEALFSPRGVPRRLSVEPVLWDRKAQTAVVAPVDAVAPEYSAYDSFLFDPRPSRMLISRRHHWMLRAVRRALIILRDRIARA